MRRCYYCFGFLYLLMTTGCVEIVYAQKADDINVSAYAPVKETESQLVYYLERIEKDLTDEATYEEDQQNRVALDASTVAVLAILLGMHDEETKYQKQASKVIELAIELADSSSEFADAKEKLAELKAAVDSGTSAGKTTWEPAADLGLLMKQVPIVNNSLRRGVTGRRFARSIDSTAGHAVTLAAIAQASLIDTSYCGDEEDEKEWQKICADMRDASAEVYKALRAKNQDRAKAGIAKIVKTCDACHHRFRD